MQTKYKIVQKLVVALWHDEKSFKIRLISGIFLIFMASGVTLSLPWCLKLIVDALSIDSPSGELSLILLSYGILWILAQGLMALRQIVVYRVFERGVRKLGMEVFEKLLNLPLSYHVNQSTGALLNVMERAQAALPDVLFGLMFIVIPLFIEILIAVGFLGYLYELKYTAVLLVLFVAYFAFTWASIGWIVSAQRKGNKEQTKVSSFIADILMNIEYVHYQDCRKSALNACQKNMVAREDAITQQLIRVDLIYLCQIAIAGLGFLILTFLVGRDVANNRLVVGDFVLFNGCLIQFLIPLNAIGISVLRSIREGLTRMEDVIDIIVMPNSADIKGGIKTLPDSPALIEFNDVSFKYPGVDYYVFSHLNLIIPAGKTVALVGANGSGKSTIVKLLYRLYEPSDGQILLNKQDEKDFSLSSLRRHIGIVPQQTLLLNDTLYANLVLDSGMSVDSDLFKLVMDEAKISDWVRELPYGYDTVIGERGVKLSGGERQRIAIARVLLRRPKIIIMDEATSALDERTENEILTRLKLDLFQISKLIITHNSKNLSFADEVITLKDRGPL